MSDSVQTKIIKVGNSKGIIVPSPIIKELALEEGDEVNLDYDYGKQVLKASFPKTKQLKLHIK